MPGFLTDDARCADLLRVARGCEREVALVDVAAAGNRLAVLHDLAGELVAHDGERIALRGTHERLVLERRQYLVERFLARPALGTVEVPERLGAVDELHDSGAHVLVLEAQRVPRLVPNYPMELRLGRLHGEVFEVERGLVLVVDAENLR